MQGGNLGQPDRVIAGPKHFVRYGGALGGRDYDEVNLSDYELWNTDFPPFRAAVEAGAGNVMTAYMPLNGVPATASGWLFTKVPRTLLEPFSQHSLPPSSRADSGPPPLH